MCIRDSYVYQIGSLCFFIRESYVRLVSRYCFIRNYAAIPVQLQFVILQYISWCVPIVWTYYYYYYYSVSPLSKKDKCLSSCSPPSIPVLCYLSPTKNFHLSYVILYITFPLALHLPVSCCWYKLAWYAFLVFLASSIPCTCPF